MTKEMESPLSAPGHTGQEHLKNEDARMIDGPDSESSVEKPAEIIGAVEGDTAAKDIGNENGGVVMSKRAMKRKAREELWAQKRIELRKRERQRLKERKKLAKENPDEAGPIRTNALRKRLKESTMASSSCKQRICIDLSLDSYMSDKDSRKCIKQIMRSYSINRRASNPCQFYITSLEGRAKEILYKNEGSEHWDVNFQNEPYSSVFSKEEIVYLSSESENVIRDLDESKVYVIGGLVDHNLHKGLCHKLASEAGFSHGRLPLDEFVDMKTRKVLTIDQVFDILVRVCNKEPWETAIINVLPQRKGAQLKGDSSSEAPAHCEDSR